MPTAAPRIQIIAFHAPVVEGGVVSMPVHTAAGLRVLQGSAKLFRAALRSLSPARVPAGPKTTHRRKPHPPAYEAMVAEHEAGSPLNWSALAKKHGVADVHHFYAWRHYQRTKAKPAPAASLS